MPDPKYEDEAKGGCIQDAEDQMQRDKTQKKEDYGQRKEKNM